jgi:ammonium transporter, Amt family
MNDLTTIIVLCLAAVLMRLGLGLQATGAVRSKNATGAMFRHVVDLCVAVLAFWAVGAAIVVKARAPDNGLFRFDPELLFGGGGAAAVDGSWLYYLSLAVIASGVVSGSVAERSRGGPLLAMTALLGALVVPVAAYWAWDGWLARLGFIDVAGASVVHLTGAVAALAAVILVGPRDNKYNRDGSANAIPGHSVPLLSAGVLVLLAAWVPYVLGGAEMRGGVEARTALNVLLAAAAGGFTAYVLGSLRYGKPDVLLTYAGLLGGLVAISAPAAVASTLGAVLIGVAAGVVVPLAVVRLDVSLRLDDLTGAIAIHGVGGALGTLAADDAGRGTVGARLQHLGVQAIGVVAIALLAFVASFALLVILKRTVGLRAREADEYDGLDLAEHDLNAYPDFQQTMIKSYHLREA